MHKILALPGSLRLKSSSNRILEIISTLIPPDTYFEIFDGIGNLPHFNDPEIVPDVVRDFKKKIREADAILICTPEYAFGVPGSLKNAIDWTVGSGEFVDKTVGLITASSQGEKGHAALLEILQAVSARVVPEATLLISFIRAKLDEKGNLKDDHTFNLVRQTIVAISEKSSGKL
jgi:chromate reductase, NAD(P)H dehydrogenase (quinone)